MWSYLVLLIVILPSITQAQYRPKISEFNYTNFFDYNTESVSNEFGNSSSEIEKEERLKLKLGIPLYIKNGRVLGTQIKYEYHRFNLDYDRQPSYALYDHIESEAFTSIGLRFMYKQKVNDSKSLSLLAGAELKSDELNYNLTTTKYFVNGTLHIQKNERTRLSPGVAIAYTLKVPQFYPMLGIEHSLTNKWTLDFNLPKKVSFRFKATEKAYLTANAEVKGWRYAVHNTSLSDAVLTLRRADLHMNLLLEREMYDWLWFGAEVGIAKNLRYFLAEPGDRRRDAKIDLSSNTAPYIMFEIFVVPPRKMYEKIKH